MYLMNFEQWVSTVFVKALGVTFAHSLWQALVALILCHIALTLAKKAAPALRYKLLISISSLLAVSVLVTFYFQFNHGPSSKDVLVNYVPLQGVLTRSANTAMPMMIQSQRFLSIVNNFFSNYMDVLVALWFIIFSFKWLRLTLGLNYIKRVTRYESSEPDEYWLNKMETLKSRLGISKTVQLLQSNIVNVPLATGFFRPVIIVPVSLFSNMSPEVVESILLHELAHIWRRDYLVNIVQSVAETVFFFNPFVLKISSLIRDERENCCDSIAVEVVQNKVSYVEALVAFGEHSNRAHTAVAFAGRKNYLLQRVKRILYNQNKKPGVMEKSILTCSVILFLGLALFSTVNGTEKVLTSSLISKFQQKIITDTVPGSENNNSDRKPSKREVKRAQREIKEQEAVVAKKQKELEEAMEELQENLKNSQEKMNEDIREKNEELNAELKELMEKQQNDYKFDLNIQNKLNLEQLDQLKKINVDAVQKQIDLVQVEKIKPALEALKIEAKVRQAQMIAAKDAMVAAKVQLQKIMIDSLSQKINLDVQMKMQSVTNEEVNDILEFLEKNNVAKKGDIKSFSLNEDELKVNNIKQPASLHDQLKEKYIGAKGDHINYMRNGDKISISIQRNRPDPA